MYIPGWTCSKPPASSTLLTSYLTFGILQLPPVCAPSAGAGFVCDARLLDARRLDALHQFWHRGTGDCPVLSALVELILAVPDIRAGSMEDADELVVAIPLDFQERDHVHVATDLVSHLFALHPGHKLDDGIAVLVLVRRGQRLRVRRD